jgi:hypothetical protein
VYILLFGEWRYIKYRMAHSLNHLPQRTRRNTKEFTADLRGWSRI